MTGFEPATLASQMQCATKLRYIPLKLILPKNNIKSYMKINKNMKNFSTYLSTAPVIATLWLILTASLLIEISRFFPDVL
jgi:photosystem I subunit 9